MTCSPSSELLFAESQKRGYSPQWITSFGMFVFFYNGRTMYAYQTKNCGNTQLYTWITTDKYATRKLLEYHNLPNIPFLFTEDKQKIISFLHLHGIIIAKPVAGEMAQGVVRIENSQQLEACALSETLFEKYQEGIEYRVLLIDGSVVAIQEKHLDPETLHPWKKRRINVERSSWDSRMVELATTIQQHIPQRLLAVDCIKDNHNDFWVLELNSMPGLWSFAHPHAGTPIDLTPQVLDLIIQSQV